MPQRPSYDAHHPADLASLSVLPLRRKRGVGHVVIADPRLPKEQRDAWEREINSKLHACGCAEASVGMLVGLFGVLAFLIVRWAGGAGFAWSDLGWAFAILFMASLVGKMVGLARAETRYRDLVRRIGREWHAAPPRAEVLRVCG